MIYKTPGAYVEETSKFPPSVAQVETAIPAFVGYTDLGTLNEPTRITSLLEYEAIFGEAKTEAFSFNASTGEVTVTPSDFKMYYALQMYFANGGGPCYIVSVGDFSQTVDKDHMLAGLAALEKEDEPTLLVFPDAPSLGATDAGAVYNIALAQSAKLGDRFVIMDVVGSSISDFRTSIASTTDLKYGAAYYPDLETVLSYNFDDTEVTVINGGTDVSYLDDLKAVNTALYNQAKTAIQAKRVILSPSSAVAGVYAKTDSTVGVWKAPANVGLNYVVAPTVKISNDIQNGLNVHAESGKSINAIRSFTGKGTLVWGARTLDGNSNEWRYVPVRRFFNMVEESTKKATEGFVFESNTANTWVRVQSMIENFLYQQWTAGALAGSKPEEAYYVSVGLNKTMTVSDILEGRMIIEVGMAAVRPAEFIVLRFSHKLQES